MPPLLGKNFDFILVNRIHSKGVLLCDPFIIIGRKISLSKRFLWKINIYNSEYSSF